MIKKSGIALVGSSIADEILPLNEPGRLTYVDAGKFVAKEELAGEDISYSVGGMALNVAVDLAKINGGYPIAVFGKIGDDFRAKLIKQTLYENKIDFEKLIIDPKYETSSTQVIYIRMPDGNIERLFRHTLGAMGSFNKQNIIVTDFIPFKIAMFGYGLLLPQLDLQDQYYGTILGSIIAQTQKLGVKTALDFVSPCEDNLFKFLRYKESIKFVDYLVINEDQACSLSGEKEPEKACISLVEKYGAKTAAVHCGAEGPNYGFSRNDGLIVQTNFPVPQAENKGNAGAGDAFSAGFLHGQHQEWSLQESLKFAAATAAVSLGDASCTGAMRNEKYILEYINR